MAELYLDNMDIILIQGKRIASAQLKESCDAWFQDMVKVVVDVERGMICVGGNLHADGEKILLEDGSKQSNIWGANFYPRHSPEERIEYTALINIRPAQNNPSMEILDPELRRCVQRLIETLILPADEELV